MKRGGAQKTHERFLRSLFPLFRANPKSELSKFINAYKSASSRLIKKEYPEVCHAWVEAFRREDLAAAREVQMKING